MKQQAYCPGCIKPVGERTFKKKLYQLECQQCKSTIYGDEKETVCPHCKSTDTILQGTWTGARKANSLCPSCRKELKQFNRILSDGGIRWRCNSCKSEGVFEPMHPFSQMFKVEKLNPNNVGLLIDKEFCPACRGGVQAGAPMPEQFYLH